ncbi:BZ3500_MvSof-1268-A1-R1_Chr4-1g06682 [Microbotryum saponariae]|uniref:NEDD8-activating enzyme E1 regulatory subunit n=1 Tax=Microbotryum saponariae TaxID=289078 RepID=A0A2X0KRT4_9BASI|nr:BZ3500_MvSof-1268-A1-R1_Chr4-1g06682 [Microbotryum saponariae]SDA06347.1 BZ3501_MvSof-1269-A2-R1_Chr4-1g06392 [Microbotryum saponariae]
MAAQDVLPPPVQDSVDISHTPLIPSTSSARPDAHTQRYDRQLRLWAKSGQSALENADILVVNATATAAQTLKNLVLPGIGKFTLLDPTKVQGSSIGNNFFLDPTSLGKNRAEQVTQFLLEMNSDVKGEAIVEDLSSLLSTSPEALEKYSLFIAVDVNPTDLLQLSDLAWKYHTPLIKVRSCVVETHPESLIDLRVHHPFPELIEYANSFNYDRMDSAEFGHVPAVVILVKALQEWRESHEGKGPSTTTERKQFADSVLAKKRQHDDENFDEAVTLFRRAGTKTGIPSEVQALFDDPSCSDVSASSANFWLLLHAVRLFTLHASNPSGLLPLSGALPDMKAHSSVYVGLQNVYRTKAQQDLHLVTSLLSQLLQSLGLDRSRIEVEEIETFVKHSAYLKVVRGRSLRMEMEQSLLSEKGKLKEVIEAAKWDDVPTRAMEIYLALRGAEVFYERRGREPGTGEGDEDGTADKEDLVGIVKEVVEGLGGGWDEEAWEEIEKTCWEVCRAGGSDLPQIAALLGGMVAQEAIKIVTKQYGPLNGTCVLNGIASATGVIKA